MAEKPKHKIEAILLTNSMKILKIVHVKIKSIKKKVKDNLWYENRDWEKSSVLIEACNT